MEQRTKEHFDALFAAGFAYRYTAERYQQLLALGGKLFVSPTHLTPGGNGTEYVEEFIQPTVLPRVLSEQEAGQLATIAEIWPLFVKAQIASVGQKPDKMKEVATEQEQLFAFLKPGYDMPLPFIRLDMVRADDGFKVVDINTTRPAGVGDNILLNDTLDQAFPYPSQDAGASFPIRERFVETVESCRQQWLESHPKRRGEPRRLTVVVPSEGEDWHNSRILAQCLQGCVRTLPELLSDAESNVLLRGRVKESVTGFGLVTERYPDKACVISPPYKRWLGNKEWFMAPFSVPLNPDRKANCFQEILGPRYPLLRRIFPKTGRVHQGKIWFWKDNGELANFWPEELPADERYMLKPLAGSSAKGIKLSWWGKRHKWDEIVRATESGIVQQYFQSKERMVILDAGGQPVEQELYAKFGLFILGNRLAGCEVMYSPRPIVHGGRDTYLTTARLPLPT